MCFKTSFSIIVDNTSLYLFQKLSRPDILDNIIMITPGLSQDPVAISMIQDPELLVRMGDIETVRRYKDKFNMGIFLSTYVILHLNVKRVYDFV